MVDFIRPNYLGELNSFRSNFINPIERGLFTDSHPGERKVMMAQGRNMIPADSFTFLFCSDIPLLQLI